jgi:MAF protein
VCAYRLSSCFFVTLVDEIIVSSGHAGPLDTSSDRIRPMEVVVGPQPIILASSSPRRRELLALSGLAFEVRPAAVDETAHPGEPPEAFVQRMSRTKAGLVAQAAPAEAVVIGADTIVVLDDEARSDDGPNPPSILGKPRDAAEAVDMLRRLRGREHRVLTAISVVDAANPAGQHATVTARVPMRPYRDDEIQAYVDSGNPLDKAGAYAIQFPAFQPVDRAQFADCLATVMGLPVCRLLRLLEQAGRPAPLAQPSADCHRFSPAGCPIYAQIDQGGHAD